MPVSNTPRILVIDDEEVVLDSCAQILEGGEYQMATATDGASGLRLVGEFAPDLVFVDLRMPGLSGFEVLEQIRKRDPAIVTIVITGYATVSSAVEAMKSGAYDFLPKPFTPDEFRLITKRGVEKRKLLLETMALRREKELLKEHFAAIVSHELKSPLGAVQQNLYALTLELSGTLTENQEKRLERMKASIDALLKLVHTWLRAYSTDIEGIREHFRSTSINSVVAKALESVQPHATRKDVEIEAKLADPDTTVHGDEGTLVEALVNLLSNAVKYSRLGSRVSVLVEARADTVLVSVADTGLGIDQDDLPYVFSGLRAGRPGVESETGAGLGLAITRQIVQAHQGSISVESELGKGSTFTICLPLLPTQGDDPAIPGKPAEEESQKEALE